LEVVKYLYEQGGKELLMLTINVSTFKLVDVEGFARMRIQMCIAWVEQAWVTDAGWCTCVTVALACVQTGASCLCTASDKGHLEVVKYLCEQGGKELLMLTNKASAFRLMDLCFCMIYTYMGPEPLNT
jgi:hypothetical protein